MIPQGIVKQVHLDFGENIGVGMWNEVVHLLSKQPITHILINSTFPHPIDFALLPSSLIHVECGGIFNCKLENLPQSLKYFDLGGEFNQPIQNLPPNLTHLTLRTQYECVKYKSETLPSNLTHLTTNPFFNCEINSLPESLKYLSLGSHFNNNVDNLPQSLEYLSLSSHFNQKVNNLPKSLKYLQITSICFNQLVDNLPPYLKKLDMYGDAFNHPVNQLPKTLRYLRIHSTQFSHPVDNLPLNLYHFEFWPSFHFPELYTLSHLPQTLKILYLTMTMNPTALLNLPPVEELCFSFALDDYNILPNSIKFLKIRQGGSVAPSLNSLSSSLTKFEFVAPGAEQITEIHPQPLLTHLFMWFPEHFDLSKLPPTLTHLGLSLFPYLKYKLHIPPSVTHLVLTNTFEELHLPPSVRYLSLSSKNSKFIQNVPTTVVTLIVRLHSQNMSASSLKIPHYVPRVKILDPLNPHRYDFWEIQT